METANHTAVPHHRPGLLFCANQLQSGTM